MFDAVNAIERDYEPYRVQLQQVVNGSARMAAAQAAHDVLVALVPAQAAAYDALLAQHLASNGAPGFEKQGAQVGARVAAEVLKWRQNDGWIVSPFPAYSEPAPRLPDRAGRPCSPRWWTAARRRRCRPGSPP